MPMAGNLIPGAAKRFPVGLKGVVGMTGAVKNHLRMKIIDPQEIGV
jgi:hypothetical protein